MTQPKLQKLADEFIKLLKERAYGESEAANEGEGDYGNWSDWRNALIEFYLNVSQSNDNKNVQS